MQTNRCFLLALGTAALAPAAMHAQLALSGYAYGIFTATGAPNTTIDNRLLVNPYTLASTDQPDDTARYETSLLFTGQGTSGANTSVTAKTTPAGSTSVYSGPTLVSFKNSPFFDIMDGETMSLGSVNFANYLTNLGTTASSFSLDLYINVASSGGSELHDFHIAKLDFTMATSGSSSTTSTTTRATDTFYLTAVTMDPQLTTNTVLDGYYATFEMSQSAMTYGTLMTPSGMSVASKSSHGGGTADLYVFLSQIPGPNTPPVPEPSTYALAGVGLLGALALRRRILSRRQD